MTTIVLVRHGETDWNREQRVQGWAPVELNERGRAQATALGEHLAATYDFDRVHASDLRRTRETTRLVNRSLSASVEFDRAWRERNFGVYQGLDYEELFDGYPEFAAGQTGVASASTVPECGESLLETRKRVLAGWRALCDDAGSSETHLVVTHGGPIYVLLGHLKGWDIVRSVLDHRSRNCSVTAVRVDGDRTEITCENESSFLP